MKSQWGVWGCVLALTACSDGGGSSSGAGVGPTGACAAVETLPINQLQVIGSHNSYRLRPPFFDDFITLLDTLDLADSLPPELDIPSLDYTHETLLDQLTQYNVRSFEIDIYHDPEGGLYDSPRLPELLALQNGEPEPEPLAAFQPPGFKVFHIPDFDYVSHQATFIETLETLRDWSLANPNHVPITVMLEAKSENIAEIAERGFRETISDPAEADFLINFLALQPSLTFTAEALLAIDTEIKTVFGEDLANVITPDQVRGDLVTLEEAVLAGNWPTLADARGKILFFLTDDSGLSGLYLEGAPNLEGRVMFRGSSPGNGDAAFDVFNGPVGNVAEIQGLVNNGYIVRTRADADTAEARTGDTSRREAAFNSGAQIVSTDYYRPDPRYSDSSLFTDFTVQLPGGGVARVNPVVGDSALLDCTISE